MDKEPKERTMDELRQVKDNTYIPPKAKVDNEYWRKVNFDCQHIVDLIQEYPNDKELGREIRGYYLSLTND
tara:strand:+ start:142 stop:354 length:213 start_codon:yes stop_codon:yes gene_type:complete